MLKVHQFRRGCTARSRSRRAPPPSELDKNRLHGYFPSGDRSRAIDRERSRGLSFTEQGFALDDDGKTDTPIEMGEMLITGSKFSLVLCQKELPNEDVPYGTIEKKKTSAVFAKNSKEATLQQLKPFVAHGMKKNERWERYLTLFQASRLASVDSDRLLSVQTLRILRRVSVSLRMNEVHGHGLRTSSSRMEKCENFCATMVILSDSRKATTVENERDKLATLRLSWKLWKIDELSQSCRDVHATATLIAARSERECRNDEYIILTPRGANTVCLKGSGAALETENELFFETSFSSLFESLTRERMAGSPWNLAALLFRSLSPKVCLRFLKFRPELKIFAILSPQIGVKSTANL